MTVVLLDPYRYASAGGPLVSDTFDRANGTGLGTADTGQSWGGNASTWRIVSNQAIETLVPAVGYEFATIDPGTANVDITVSATPNAGSGNDFGLVARFTDTSNHILFDVTKDAGGWLCRAFEKVGGGSYTGVTTLQNPPAGLNNTYDPFSIRLVVNGTAGEVFLTSMADPFGAWTSMGTWTINGALTANTVAMAAAESQAVAWNNFQVVAA